MVFITIKYTFFLLDSEQSDECIDFTLFFNSYFKIFYLAENKKKSSRTCNLLQRRTLQSIAINYK